MKLYFVCPKITTVPHYNIYSIHSSREVAEKMCSRLICSEQYCVISGDYEIGQGHYMVWYVDVTEEPGFSYTLFDSLCDSKEKAHNYIKLLSPEIRKKASIRCWWLYRVYNWKCELNWKWETGI